MSKYIVFEGVDGVGKTTIMREVAKYFPDAVLTKEPGGPKALEAEGFPALAGYDGFRELCVNNPQIPGVVKRAIYLADRLYNLETVVEPALKQGRMVLSDRSWVSDLAYGTVLTNCTMEQLYAFNHSLKASPDMLVIYLHARESIREARLKVTDAMDSLGSEKRAIIAGLYPQVFIEYNVDYIPVDTKTDVNFLGEFISNKIKAQL